MNDWQEAYYDLVNKVECECVQQGDLVPIWEQFKRMSLTIQKLQGHQGALEAEIEQMREALGWFLNDSRFVVQVGGNPNVVPQMIEAARAALGETK